MNRQGLRVHTFTNWLAALGIAGMLSGCIAGAPLAAPGAPARATLEANAAATQAPAAEAPAASPTELPAEAPIDAPTEAPAATETPTAAPTLPPTVAPTETPTETPTAIPTAAPAAPATMRLPFVGLGIIGDSTQDEYRGTNPRGGEYVLTTLNWVELLAELRGVNLGPVEDNPEPRREGLAYNWARSGATTANMIYTEQHVGLARQVAAGLVSHVILQIGINDFDYDGLGLSIYEGTLTGPELNMHLDTIAFNIATAAETVQQAGSVHMMLAATQDYVTLPIVPELYTEFQDPDGRQRLVDAFAALNGKIKAIAELKGIAYFDYNAAMLEAVNARYDGERFLNVGGELIDLRTRGNEPHHGLLDDEYVHPGTVLSGLAANVYINAMNQVFGTEIAPLSDEEILKAAGIRP